METRLIEAPASGEVRDYKMLVGGDWVDALSGKTFESINPYTGRALLADGLSPEDLAEMTLGDAPISGEFDTYLDRRAELGLDVSEGAPLVVDPDGNRVPREAVVAHLRFARLTRVSIEGNAELCRGLLAARYGTPGVRGKEKMA